MDDSLAVDPIEEVRSFLRSTYGATSVKRSNRGRNKTVFFLKGLDLVARVYPVDLIDRSQVARGAARQAAAEDVLLPTEIHTVAGQAVEIVPEVQTDVAWAAYFLRARFTERGLSFLDAEPKNTGVRTDGSPVMFDGSVQFQRQTVELPEVRIYHIQERMPRSWCERPCLGSVRRMVAAVGQPGKQEFFACDSGSRQWRHSPGERRLFFGSAASIDEVAMPASCRNIRVAMPTAADLRSLPRARMDASLEE